MEPEVISKMAVEAMFKGFFWGIWMVFKTLWWLIPLALILRWINKKNNKWKRRN